VAELCRRVEALEALVAAQDAIIAALQQAGASRDDADRALRRTLLVSTEARRFPVTQLIRHAKVDDRLRLALENASLQTPDEIGAWLRDHRGVEDGIAIIRQRRRQWQVVHVEHVT
jgi:hypothetical protein